MIDYDKDQNLEIVVQDDLSNEPEHGLQPEDLEAIRQAQQEADERYKRVYNRQKNKKEKKAHWITKVLAAIYLLALTLFAANITTLDVLPIKHLSAVIACIVTISALVLLELCRSNVNKWIRVVVSLLCVALTAVYCFGTLYIIRTMNFLDITTENSEKKVESPAYEPFNIMITGIDVSGTIDEKGRSDVNMLITVNPNTAQILMTSIPRDYMIYMPDKGYEMDKLTHTSFYGVETTNKA